jgi:hypothetical protein
VIELAGRTGAVSSPSAASLQRLEIVRRIIPVYAANANVRAVFVAGSVARGWADESSDVEIPIICAKPPTNAERQWCAKQTGGKLGRFEGYNPAKWTWPEEVWIEGVKLDMAWITPETVEKLLADVIDRHDPQFNKQMYCAIIRRAVVLHGPEVMAPWQEKTASYPDALKETIVRRDIFFERASVRRLLVRRNDLPLLAEHDTHCVRKLLWIWLALNGEYYPGFKWTRELIASLALVPGNAFGRIENVFRSSPTTGGEELGSLIRDTFALVEEHLPQVKIGEARAEFESA